LLYYLQHPVQFKSSTKDSTSERSELTSRQL
jgi:hypothetical protein